MPDLQVAREGNFSHDTFHECRLTLTVLTYKGYFLTALYGEGDMFKHGVVAVVLSHVVANDRIVTTSQAGRKMEMHGRIVDFVHFHWYDLLQLANALLHLHGLCGLIAEALDKLLDVGYLLLLVGIGPQLLFSALFAQVEVLVVFYAVVLNVMAGDLYGAVGDIVDKRAVVAHQHDSFRACGEELLKPLYALDVEMVGRLIEQQYVGMPQQYLGQLNSHSPSARELFGGAVEIGPLKAQTCQRALYFGLIVVAAEQQIAVVLLCKLLDELLIFLALVVGT